MILRAGGAATWRASEGSLCWVLRTDRGRSGKDEGWEARQGSAAKRQLGCGGGRMRLVAVEVKAVIQILMG